LDKAGERFPVAAFYLSRCSRRERE